MDLKSGYPFWAVKNGLMNAFPRLESDIVCDVLVLGGGITGALTARALADAGMDTVVIEQRDIGWGSTAASTALLQYEIDTPMIELCDLYGEADAALAYRACLDAIGMLQVVAGEVRDVDFARMHSLYFASKPAHVRDLREEFELRMKYGLPVQWLDADTVRAGYGFDAPAAILSTVAARVDPYRLTHRVLAQLAGRGVRVFDRTQLESFTPRTRDVLLRTTDGVGIRARHLVIAAGYASQHHLDTSVARNRSSYAMVTDPIAPDRLGPLADTMLWETARPYLYMRATGDGRLVIGGEDDAIDLPARRDAMVGRKAARLRKRVAALFPQLPLPTAFAWAGTFAETSDGLPFFGPHPQHGPRVSFAMAYGGNGITYSALGAELIAATLTGKPHPLRELFGFARLTR